MTGEERDDASAAAEPPAAGRPDEDHFETAADAILAGDVTPFLGAGVNTLHGEAAGGDEVELPDASGLAEDLFHYAKEPDVDPHDLARVSQAVDVLRGWKPLYRRLRSVFTADYQPTAVHRFLATLPARLRNAGSEQQLIVTTNYDDAMARAFADAGEGTNYDVVSYIAGPNDPHRGRFRHRSPDGTTQVIENANSYLMELGERPTILKIHGSVDRDDPSRDAFVITEDHYIDFLASTDVQQVLPINLRERMKESHTLFLGYGLRDWNLRVFLREVWGDESRQPGYTRWAVQLDPKKLDVKFWQRSHVDVFNITLGEYLRLLAEYLEELDPG